MRGCLRFLAGLVAMVFVVAAVIAALVVPLLRIVTNPDAMKEALAGLDAIAAQAAPGLVADALAAQAAENGLTGVEIDEAMVAGVMDDLLPPGWIAAQADTAVDTIYDAIEAGSLEEAELTIDARPLIAQLRGSAGERLVAGIVDGLPACTGPIDPATLLNGNGDLPSCIPPEIPREVIVQQVHARYVQALDENPQIAEQAGIIRVPLSQALNAESEQAVEMQRQLQQARRALLLARRWGWTLWLIPVLCLLLIVLLAVRSLSAWGHWWGWPLLVAAVFVFLLTLVLPALGVAVVETAVLPSQAGATAFPIQDLTQSVLGSVTEMWRSRVYIQAGVMLGLGAFLVAIGFLTASQRTK